MRFKHNRKFPLIFFMRKTNFKNHPDKFQIKLKSKITRLNPNQLQKNQINKNKQSKQVLPEGRNKHYKWQICNGTTPRGTTIIIVAGRSGQKFLIDKVACSSQRNAFFVFFASKKQFPDFWIVELEMSSKCCKFTLKD